jgi:hypothetical protein
MDHSPGSHTFVHYYGEGFDCFDIVNIMLDRGDGSDAQGVLQHVGMVALHHHNLAKPSVDGEIIIRTFVFHVYDTRNLTDRYRSINTLRSLRPLLKASPVQFCRPRGEFVGVR